MTKLPDRGKDVFWLTVPVSMHARDGMVEPHGGGCAKQWLATFLAHEEADMREKARLYCYP